MAPLRRPHASVIIPNWNGARLLAPCLRSLRQQTYDDFEIIVVDNASTDDSVAMVQHSFPEVRLVVLDANLGYSGGCNAGIAASWGEILVMLNNDTEVEREWLGALVDAMAQHPTAGSAASRLMIFDRRDVIHSAGDQYGRDGIPESRGVWQHYGAPYDTEAHVFGACGGGVALRRQLLEEIGGFEERFFMYCEDVDLNWRAQLAGWKCIYVPDAVIYHHLSATGGGSLASYYVGRNTLWVIARNYPGRLMRKYWWRIVAAQWSIALAALRSRRGAAARARLRGQLIGLLTSLRWLGHRRALRREMRVDADYIESILQ